MSGGQLIPGAKRRSSFEVWAEHLADDADGEPYLTLAGEDEGPLFERWDHPCADAFRDRPLNEQRIRYFIQKGCPLEHAISVVVEDVEVKVNGQTFIKRLNVVKEGRGRVRDMREANRRIMADATLSVMPGRRAMPLAATSAKNTDPLTTLIETITSNEWRSATTPLGKADQVARLHIAHGVSLETIAERGIFCNADGDPVAHSTIVRWLAISQMPKDLRELVATKALSADAALALSRMPEDQREMQLAMAVAGSANGAATVEAAAEAAVSQPVNGAKQPRDKRPSKSQIEGKRTARFYNDITKNHGSRLLAADAETAAFYRGMLYRAGKLADGQAPALVRAIVRGTDPDMMPLPQSDIVWTALSERVSRTVVWLMENVAGVEGKQISLICKRLAKIGLLIDDKGRYKRVPGAVLEMEGVE